MSHFTVGIITREPIEECDLDRILAPYDENREVRHVITKAEIIAKSKANIESYKNTTYKKYLEDPEGYIANCGNKHHIDYIQNEFPKKLSWTDEECYQDEIRYYDEENIMPNGDVVSYYNTDAKWDWYVIGGRWSDLLQTKDGWCDSAKLSEITNWYDKEAERKAKRFWELYVDGVSPVNEEDENMLKYVFYSKDYYQDAYGDIETYAKCQAALTTYAIIDEYGSWHAKGEMGWWGITTEDYSSEAEWLLTSQKVLKEALEKGYYLTIVDCHI